MKICSRCGHTEGQHYSDRCPMGAAMDPNPTHVFTHGGDEHHSPQHYKKSIETIDAMRSWLGDVAFVQYCRGNVIKYMARLGEKDESVKEARKAEVYLRWMRETLEGKGLSK